MRCMSKCMAMLVIVSTLLYMSAYAQEAMTSQDQATKAVEEYLTHTPDTYLQFMKCAGQLGARALPALIDILIHGDNEHQLGARKVIEAIVHYATNSSEYDRAMVTATLIASLKLNIPIEAKKFIIEMLGYVGIDDAVPPLAELLFDAQLREPARRALERIPVRSATRALVNALMRTHGAFKVALINSLGAKRDPAVTHVIQRALNDESERVRIAALEALGRIPARQSAEVLKEFIMRAKGFELQIAVDAYLRLADALLANGDRELAGEMYCWAYKIAPKLHFKCAALIGMANSLGPDAAKILVKALSSKHYDMRGAAMRALLNMRDERITGMLTKELSKVHRDVRLMLIAILAQRGDVKAVPALISLLRDRDEDTQLAAVNALGQLNDARAVPALVELALRATDGVADAAVNALAKIQASGVTDAILNGLKRATGDGRVRLIRALGSHKESRAVEYLLNATEDVDERVIIAAIEGLGLQCSSDAIPRLAELAETGASDDVKRAALRSYIQTADALRKEAPAKALEMYHHAMEIAMHDDERKMALHGIAGIGNPASLPVIEPLIEERRFPEECAAVVAAIADTLVRENAIDEAVKLYKRAIMLTSDRRFANELADKLRNFGIRPGDVAAERGYITRWWVIGPINGRDKWRDKDAIPIDAIIDVTHTVITDGREFKWKYVRADDPLGKVDLERFVARRDYSCAYLYTEVSCNEPRDVVFKIGSDDDVVVWVNGERIHQFIGDRGWSPDQDEAVGKLKAGVNTILVKVLNGRAQWAFSLRALDADGKPLQLDRTIMERVQRQARKNGFVCN
ncbi:MAG TPA: HEAT repeat domain-containing protein, partial [Armatimonadetes bacterium]|nr:HEAT repeat domain-containing protein [Armatimonadota bacterium]